jgi:GTPase SAR1 family protein
MWTRNLSITNYQFL